MFIAIFVVVITGGVSSAGGAGAATVNVPVITLSDSLDSLKDVSESTVKVVVYCPTGQLVFV
tara:strand:+ start:419 stop:604 length:186 start_codon:yes stop_codon:yes gene_type:complete